MGALCAGQVPAVEDLAETFEEEFSEPEDSPKFILHTILQNFVRNQNLPTKFPFKLYKLITSYYIFNDVFFKYCNTYFTISNNGKTLNIKNLNSIRGLCLSNIPWINNEFNKIRYNCYIKISTNFDKIAIGLISPNSKYKQLNEYGICINDNKLKSFWSMDTKLAYYWKYFKYDNTIDCSIVADEINAFNGRGSKQSFEGYYKTNNIPFPIWDKNDIIQIVLDTFSSKLLFIGEINGVKRTYDVTIKRNEKYYLAAFIVANFDHLKYRNGITFIELIE